MKRFLFIIFVILMTPIYLILRFLGWFLSGFVELMTDITEPIADGINEFFENMMEFWKKVMQEERERAKSMANIAQTIINNGELALKAVKHYDEYGKKEAIPEILQIGDGKEGA